jgi:hypothetical protein
MMRQRNFELKFIIPLTEHVKVHNQHFYLAQKKLHEN